MATHYNKYFHRQYDWFNPDIPNYTPEQRPYSFSTHWVHRPTVPYETQKYEMIYSDRMSQWDLRQVSRGYRRIRLGCHVS